MSNITTAQQGEIARILGFPNISPMNSLQLEYPTFASQYALWQPYATLLNRLAQCSPYDEVQYIGAESPVFGSYFTPSVATINFSTPSSIAVGTILQINLGVSQETYVTVAGDTPASVAAAVATLVRNDAEANTTYLANANAAAMALFYVAQLGTDGNGKTILVTSSSPTLLAAIGTGSPGQAAFGQTSGGQVPPGPQYTPQGETETVFGYVPIIHTLESDFINSRINLDTLRAGTGGAWQPRQDELDQRYRLWFYYRKELANRLGVPVAPDLIGNDSQGSSRLV